MRHTTTACLFTAALLTLSGCSLVGGSDGSTKPSTGTNASAAAADTQQIAACRDAIVAQKNDSADNGLPQCTKLSPDEYLKALKEADQKGKDAAGKESASAQP